MTTKRRKADKLQAPQTTEEAIRLLGRFAELDAAIEEENLRAEQAMSQIREARDLFTEGWKAELKALFNQLKPWWAVASAELTEGKRKSIELGGCHIGTRVPTPSLKLKGIGEGTAIMHLETLGFEAWALRTVPELDKPAIMAALKNLGATGPDGELNADGQDAAALAGVGFYISQAEQFFIARIPPVEPAVETVPDVLETAVRP